MKGLFIRVSLDITYDSTEKPAKTELSRSNLRFRNVEEKIVMKLEDNSNISILFVKDWKLQDFG